MVKPLKENPFLFPAVIVAVLLYSKILSPAMESPYSSLVKREAAVYLKGVVASCPVRLGGINPSYKMKVRLIKAGSADGLVSNASGLVDVFVPASMFEIYQPGRLYTDGGHLKEKDLLIDKGAVLSFCAEPASAFWKVTDVLECVYPKRFFGALNKARALCRLHFTRLMFAWGSGGGLLLALLSGSRSYLEPEVSDAFRAAGLSHILALSGMHLSLFGSLAFFMGKRFFGKRGAAIFELAAVILFVWFAGKSPSLFRALLCSLCVTFSSLFKVRIKSMLNVLALAFLVHTAAFPLDLFELGFMLSYGALFGILFFTEFVSKPLLRIMPPGISESLSESTGAQIATAPICIKNFSCLSPVGIFASFFVGPLVTAFVYLGLFCICLSLAVPFFAPACGGLLNILYFAIKKAAVVFAKVPQLVV